MVGSYPHRNSTGFLHIVDKNNPGLIGGYEWDQAVWTVHASGDIACVGSYYSLIVLSLSDPANPRELSRIQLSTPVNKVWVKGGYVFIASDWYGLMTVNISDPTNPEVVGATDTPGFADYVHIEGNYAYVADSYAGVQVIDLSSLLQ